MFFQTYTGFDSLENIEVLSRVSVSIAGLTLRS